MRIPDIKQLVTGNREAAFVRYSDGQLWYAITYAAPDSTPAQPHVVTFEFPVPIDDTGTGVFLAKDKALIFMRWIRKHLSYLQAAIEKEK